MRNLALSDEILLKVEKPARYIGNEVNSVMKDKQDISVRFAMCFPDVYEIGMSHLGIQILYDMFNRFEDTWCERVYSPWPDLDAVMREKRFPCLRWNHRIRSGILTFWVSRSNMRCATQISCRYWICHRSRCWQQSGHGNIPL